MPSMRCEDFPPILMRALLEPGSALRRLYATLALFPFDKWFASYSSLVLLWCFHEPVHLVRHPSFVDTTSTCLLGAIIAVSQLVVDW